MYVLFLWFFIINKHSALLVRLRTSLCPNLSFPVLSIQIKARKALGRRYIPTRGLEIANETISRISRFVGVLQLSGSRSRCGG